MTGRCEVPLVHSAPRSFNVNRVYSVAHLATELERQLTTARADQTTGLSNGRVANWAPEVEFSFFRQITFPFCR